MNPLAALRLEQQIQKSFVDNLLSTFRIGAKSPMGSALKRDFYQTATMTTGNVLALLRNQFTKHHDRA
jgi:hypothetical protein